MHEIAPRLWIANALEIRDPRTLFEHEIAAVVDLAAEEPCAQLPREMIYCRVPLTDGGGNPAALLRLAVRTVSDLIEAETPTAVACSAGMSRSPAIVAFAIAAVSEELPEEVVARIQAQKPVDLNGTLWNNMIEALPEISQG